MHFKFLLWNQDKTDKIGKLVIYQFNIIGKQATWNL